MVNFENFIGTANRDIVRGTNGANNLSGLGGNDDFLGRGGNDAIDGGAGIDRAIYSGARAQYFVHRLPGGRSWSPTCASVRLTVSTR